MAKIGNEAKLILKLAEERINKNVKRHNDEAALADGTSIYATSSHRNKAVGNEEALATLKSIYLEMLDD